MNFPLTCTFDLASLPSELCGDDEIQPLNDDYGWSKLNPVVRDYIHPDLKAIMDPALREAETQWSELQDVITGYHNQSGDNVRRDAEKYMSKEFPDVRYKHVVKVVDALIKGCSVTSPASTRY